MKQYVSQRRCCAVAGGSPSRYLEQLKLMLDQVNLMKNAQASLQPDYALLLEFPELLAALQVIEKAPGAFGVPKDQDVLDAFSDLIRRYAEEWVLFPYQLGSA